MVLLPIYLPCGVPSWCTLKVWVQVSRIHNILYIIVNSWLYFHQQVQNVVPSMIMIPVYLCSKTHAFVDYRVVAMCSKISKSNMVKIGHCLSLAHHYTQPDRFSPSRRLSIRDHKRLLRKGSGPVQALKSFSRPACWCCGC